MTNKPIACWLFLVAALAGIMVVLGGVVRLTESGLSMVDWHLVTGMFPPTTHDGWIEEFGKYQQSPEYQQVNFGMSLSDFKFIYYMEYSHRMLGRVVGLVYFLPFFFFWAKGAIRRTELLKFISIGALLGLQGLYGWYMVQSGLVDMPRVSHYRLTGHLLLALAFLALCVWTGLSWLNRESVKRGNSVSSQTRRIAIATFALLLAQITLGGFVAGLRAGLVSNTFPKMAGAWIPDFVWSMQPWYVNFFENPFMLHFLHRWNGFLVLFAAGIMLFRFRRENISFVLQITLRMFVMLIAAQVFLGVLTIFLQVPVVLASVHQALALLLFAVLLVVLFQIKKPKSRLVIQES
jgi:cytochrome c oxidase assembly protein subunit 15